MPCGSDCSSHGSGGVPGTVRLLGETQQVVTHIGVPGVKHRLAVDDEAIPIDFGCEHRSGRGPQTVRILLHGRDCTFEHEVDFLRVGRAQAEGHGVVGVDLRREVGWQRRRGGGGVGRGGRGGRNLGSRDKR